jgi:tetratricopeptide (TPR) repeat protein
MPRSDRRPQRAAHGGTGERHERGTSPTLTPDQRAEVEELLVEIGALARALRGSQSDGREALSAQLGRVEQVTEPVAIAFAARLGDMRGERAADAADVAAAIGELDPRREVAREARRARLRVRSAGVAPSLVIPPLPVTAAQVLLATEGAAATHLSPVRRLIEAHVTRSRDSGEVSMALGWQEGADPDILRAHIFLLEFWREGLKDFSQSEPMTRRRFQQNLLGKLKSSEEGVTTTTLTWAQARRLVQEAIEVNEALGVSPHEDFRTHRALVDEWLLGEPADDETRQATETEAERFAREGDRPYLAPDMEPEETIANWIGAWSFGDYGLVYDLLADDNPLRRAQSRTEFISLRRQWAKEAKPAALRVTLIREQERRASALWVPGAATGGLGQARDYETFWSLTLQDSSIGGQLEELPMGTLISAETGRHWYWTAYSLRRDRTYGLWTIASIRDEGKAAQGLTIEELQQRIKEAHEKMEHMAEAAPQNPSEKEATELVRELTATVSAALHYHDALIARLPLDEAPYRAAVDDARGLANHERAAALLERMVSRFSGAARLRYELGLEQYLAAEVYSQQGYAEGANAWLDRAIATLASVIEEEPTADHLQALGEVLMRRGLLTQAETRLREAIARKEDQATLHADLASVLMAQASGENLEDPGQPEKERQQALAREALAELRRTSQLDSALPHLFTRMGAIYEILGQPDDARIALEEALKRDPGDADASYALGSLLLSRSQPQQALPLLETAVQLEPLAVPYRLSLAGAYAALERRREAERELNLVDRLAPGLPQVAELRGILARSRKK